MEFGVTEFIEVPILRGLYEVGFLWDEGHLSNDTYICGGYVRHCVSPIAHKHNPPAGDLDIYCRDQIAFDAIKESLTKVGKFNIKHEGARSCGLTRESHESLFN